MPKNDSKQPICCSFCGRSQAEVEHMIANNGVYICDSCVQICMDIMRNDGLKFPRPSAQTPAKKETPRLPNPAEMKKTLDEYVIGQDRAKIALSVAVYNHYKRIYSNDSDDDVELQKSNVLLLGPTGVGKTYLAQTLAKMLHVPFAIADATTLTEAGYVGDDVENILLRLIQAADYDVSLAEIGIIYLDEVDKISRKSENVSITRDVSGEGVQQALLKILEGTVATVAPQGGRKHPQMQTIPINTKNILFILGGAFDGLETIIRNRLGKSVIGFAASNEKESKEEHDQILAKVIPQDLVKFGLIPELVGRIPSINTLESLDRDALVRILSEPKNSLVKQYQKLFKLDGIELAFTPEALCAIADKAIELGTGARGLRAILENTLQDVMFHAPSDYTIDKVVVTEACITGDAPVEVLRNPEKKPRQLNIPMRTGPKNKSAS